MSTVLEHPATELADTDYHAFNRALWEKLVADPTLARLDFRIETDRHGQMIMSPPPAPSHGSRQSRITRLLGNLLQSGEVISECPVSTRAGVKVTDVAWCSPVLWQRFGKEVCFLQSPEICVEVISPSNTRGELDEKKRLYFEEGAEEVWFCNRDGVMRFFHHPEEPARDHSVKVPDFPPMVA